MLVLMCFVNTRLGRCWLCLALGLAGCQPQREPADKAIIPPVGHYEGSLKPAGQPEMRAALDIRHPSPGHYEAEFTTPAMSTLSFVADTILFRNNQLQLTRPSRPGQTLTLALEGDFWRGALATDSTKTPLLLVKRGVPTPSTYRVEEVPQAAGSAWLFSPADTSTPGDALALLPSADTAPTAAIWADALAREGIIVLLLPAVSDSATAPAEAPRLQAALRLLRGTAGADTASVGVWAAGARAAATAQVLVAAGGPRVSFFITQNPEISPAGRTALRELQRRKVPLLGLYGGPEALRRAATLRSALGGRRSAAVRPYRATGPDLLLPGSLAPGFGPGLPGEIIEWLRGR